MCFFSIFRGFMPLASVKISSGRVMFGNEGMIPYLQEQTIIIPNDFENREP